MGPRMGGLAILVGIGSVTARADQFHYQNILIGDRAVGLGGAYGGVSDDASGVFYNPGGMAFALSNDVSGSANAFFSRKVVYKGAIGNRDFEEHSRGSVPSFFGGLQKLDRIAEGLVAGFAIYSTDGETKDQDDLVKDQNLGNGVALDRLHRTVNFRGSTTYFAAAISKRFFSRLGIGLGASFFSVDELFQDYQDVRMRLTCTRKVTQNGVDSRENLEGCQRFLTQNIREHLSATGIEPVLGVQWAPITELSVGLSVKRGILLTDEIKRSTDARVMYLFDGDLVDNVVYSGTGVSPTGIIEQRQEPEDEGGTIKDALGEWPMESRLGLAWFASTRLLVTGDIVYKGSAKGKDTRQDRGSVTNFGLGAEVYATPSIPIRAGIFTNNDARPDVDPKKANQPDHIDYKGASLFLGWVQPNSQISVGTVAQRGTGSAQKAGGEKIQDVEAQSVTFAFSASHNF